ncbi:UDP-glucosyltransferase 2-like [Planococcus citri]|uniref:UDP-glucosyltransferase 2-like n=1 Tax=Planococcus citri TaxID=170843 RepID=UPI0031F898B4
MMSNIYFRILTISFIFSNLTTIESAKILGIFIIFSKSHHSVSQPIVKGLAARGHEVTVVSHFKSSHTVPNYTEILLPEANNFIDTIDIKSTQNYSDYYQYKKFLRELENSHCDHVLSLEFIKELIFSKEKTIDLIIGEIYFTQCYHLLAYTLNVPLILFLSPSLGEGVHYFVGNPCNPSFIPVKNTLYTTRMSFFERLDNAFQYSRNYWFQSFVINADTERYAREVFKMEPPSSEELNKKAALGFYNSHFSFIGRPMSPNAIEIGGIHIKERKKLSKDLEDFIEGFAPGVIFFSFGTTIKASSISSEKLKIIIDTFASIPQRVLWRVNELNISESIPPNVKLGKWFPQRDILEHKNVIGFISHCGLLGTLEAVHTSTPVIGMPFSFDQFQNANILAEKGAGIHVDYFTMTKYIFARAIEEIITNPKYRENMQKLSMVFKDRPRSPLDESLYWSEYVIKHQGAPHLRTTAADMPLYQYLLLDVLAVILGTAIGILCICKLLLRIGVRFSNYITYTYLGKTKKTIR